MRLIKRVAVLVLLTIAPLRALAALPEVVIEIRDHLFIPQTVRIPEGRKVRLVFINHDPSPEEIDSFDLNREKVIFGNSNGTIFVGPLPSGSYKFFGELHPNSAVGYVIVTNEEATDAD
tara:strand:+ start:156 stop:512 length:357 start_codon:yes stop_codon:yes gene_type:complete